MADGVWNTQINGREYSSFERVLFSGFWVALVGRSSLDFAFTNYRIWESLGIACGYLMARSLTVNAYLLVSAGFLLVGMVGYSFLENYELVKVGLFEYTIEIVPGIHETDAECVDRAPGEHLPGDVADQ